MKIRVIYPDEKDLKAVQARVFEIADANDIPREDAIRQALLLWLRAWREQPEAPEVTEAEWAKLAPVLERIRAGSDL